MAAFRTSKSLFANHTGTEFDLGSFEGFNFREQSAIQRNLTANEVIAWDHDAEGEAEFWPAGDRAEVALIFRGKTAVTGSELSALEALLRELGSDSSEHFIKIYRALQNGGDICELTASQVEDFNGHIFFGTNFMDLRKEAAYELFELYYPEAYAAWEKSLCDGLVFDIDLFLNSPSLSVEEITLSDQVVLLIEPQ